jgi:hypothetical protein
MESHAVPDRKLSKLKASPALVLAALVACSIPPPGPGIDVDRVMVHVGSMMVLGPRPGESEHAREAALYIEKAVTEAGGTVERFPVGVVDLTGISVMGATYRDAHRVESTDPDLVVRFGPPGKVLLIMAHYDTVPGSPGAVDNATAVGVLIELARVLERARPEYGVMLVFTANEEIGLVGAEALAARLGDDVAFAIALDLIGGSGDLVLNGAGELIGADEMRWLAAAAQRAGIVLRAPLAHRVVSRWWPQVERSDHGPFTRRGIRAVHFYDRGQDGEWIDLAYHSPGDLLPRVDRTSVDEVGRLLFALTRLPPPQPGGADGFWLPIVANRIIPRAALIGGELVLALVTLLALLSLRTARERVGLGVFAGLVCFAGAAGITLGVEVLVRGDHPAPWLHAPLRAEIAGVLVLGGSLGLLVMLARRLRPWIGELRYLAIAAAIPLAVGSTLLALGGAELAWIWLAPAATIALAPRFGAARVLAVVAAAFPAVLVLTPDQLREAAWNGFLPPVPLAVLLAAFLLPVAAAGAWLLRRRGGQGPLGAFVLPVGCLLSVVTGVVLASRAHPTCTPEDFNQFHLACERGSGVR